MKTTYDVIIWIATINRETHLIEPKDILIAHGLRTKRAAQNTLNFTRKNTTKKKTCMKSSCQKKGGRK